MSHATADLCDAHADAVRVVGPILHDFGGRSEFCGPIVTLRALEDNSVVRATLETAGQGAVLVVDGGGSQRCALVGDKLAQLAIDNGWAGLIIYGCVRDSTQLKEMPLGIKALGVCPRRSRKLGHGEREVPVTFGGVLFEPGAYVYADGDGIVVSPPALEA